MKMMYVIIICIGDNQVTCNEIKNDLMHHCRKR